jgi:hypothetical protein
MEYSDSELQSLAESLYKTSSFIWPLFIVGGVCSGLFFPIVLSSQLGEFALPLGAFLAVIGFLIGYASAVVLVSFLRIQALKALRSIKK